MENGLFLHGYLIDRKTARALHLHLQGMVEKQTVAYGLHGGICHGDGAKTGEELRMLPFQKQPAGVIIHICKHTPQLPLVTKDAVMIARLPKHTMGRMGGVSLLLPLLWQGLWLRQCRSVPDTPKGR